MAKFAANLSMLFTEVDFMDRLKPQQAKRLARGVLFPYAFEADKN